MGQRFKSTLSPCPCLVLDREAALNDPFVLTHRPDCLVPSRHRFLACGSRPAVGGCALHQQAGAGEDPTPLTPTPPRTPAPPALTLAVAVGPAQDSALLYIPEGFEEAAHVVLRLLLVEHTHEEFSIFWNKIRRCLPGPRARRRVGRPGVNRARREKGFGREETEQKRWRWRGLREKVGARVGHSQLER